MKIKSIYNKLINEVTKGKFIAYHGSNYKIDKFVDEFVGADEAKDYNGPGIYFTTNYDEAYGYGKYVYTVELSGRKYIDDITPSNSVDINELIKLVKMAPDWVMNAENYDENPNKGVWIFVNDAIESNDNEKDVFLQVWIDFYRYNPIDYVRNMVKLGYDGLIDNNVSGGGHKHIIIYNPSIINVLEIDTKR